MDVVEILKKMRHVPGSGGYVINSPDEIRESFVAAGLSKSPIKGHKSKFTLIFVRNKAEVESILKPSLGLVEYDSVIWAAYPKGGTKGTDINRDILWKLAEPMGYRPVSQVAIDDTWSALRLRPVEKVKRKEN